MNHAPMLAVLDALDRSSVPVVNIQSRPFPGDPMRTAYIVSGPTAADVQRAVTEIMGSLDGIDARADFVAPYAVWHGAIRTWEAKGIVERHNAIEKET